MKFYYLALAINKEKPIRTFSGKRLAYYIDKNQALKEQCRFNTIYRGLNSHKEDKAPYKLYCVESEPMEVTSD